MTLLIKANNQTDIDDKLLDYVHDSWFDFDEIQFDKDKKILTIPLSVIIDDKPIKERKKFFFIRTWQCPVFKSDLIFKNVTNFILNKENEEDVESFINTIYKKDEQLIIDCSGFVDATIELDITACEIELMISDIIINEKTRSCIFGIIESES